MSLAIRTDLDRLRCEHPDCEECGPLYLHSHCHPEVPLWVSYHHGELELVCSECEAQVARVAVAG